MTQKNTVLKHLRKYRSITNMEALVVYGIYRLGAAVYDLRREGHNIVNTMKQDEMGRRYSHYSLEDSLDG